MGATLFFMLLLMDGAEAPAELYAIPIFLLFMDFVMYKIYNKCNEEGWTAFVPILNTYTLLKIAEFRWWFLILFFIPGINLIISLFVLFILCDKFGKGVPFLIGIIFFPYIFLPILAFGNSKYNKTKVLTKQEKEQEEIKSQNRLFDKLSGE